MTSCLQCSCIGSARRQREHHHEEPNAFDLTWSNYILSTYFGSCTPKLFRKKQPIRLEDDEDDEELFLGPDYYNEHCQGRAVHGYLDNARDRKFDSVLYDQQDSVPHFVTRNPFGKAKKKKKKHRKRHDNILPGGVIPEDAEFLDDDQIANFAYRIDQDEDADQYGEETYIDSPRHAPAIQEMQPPPPKQQRQQKEFYAAKTMPSFVLSDEEQHPEQAQPSGAADPDSEYAAATAQNLLSERLEDLTDKLAYIKKNIMNMNGTPSDNEADKATLHTLKTLPNEQQPADSRTDSDIGSIGSQALDEYESTSEIPTPYQQRQDGDDDDRLRRHSGVSQFRIPFGAVESPPFGSDRHPFSYFTDRSAAIPENDDDQLSTTSSKYSDTPGFNLQGVLNFGKRWLGA